MEQVLLVTGARGAAGSYLYNWLLNNVDARVWGHAREKKQHGAEQSDWSFGDLVEPGEAARIVYETRPSTIYNMASWPNVLESFEIPVAYVSNNVLSTLHLLEACRRYSIVFLHASTSEVYGSVTQEEVPIRETAPLRPVSPYACSKTAQDLLVECYWRSYGLHTVRTRAFGYVNPRRNDLALTAFAKQIVRIEQGAQKVLVHGNLASVRTFCDVRDLCGAYYRAALLGVGGEAYNIGSTEPISMGDALDILRFKAKAPIPLKQDRALMRPADVTYQIPDVSKFEKLTGWRPKIGLEEGLSWLLEECRRV